MLASRGTQQQTHALVIRQEPHTALTLFRLCDALAGVAFQPLQRLHCVRQADGQRGEVTIDGRAAALRLRALGVQLPGRRSAASRNSAFPRQQLVAFLGDACRRDGVETVGTEHATPVVKALRVLCVRLILVGQFVERVALALTEMSAVLHVVFGLAPPTPGHRSGARRSRSRAGIP